MSALSDWVKRAIEVLPRDRAVTSMEFHETLMKVRNPQETIPLLCVCDEEMCFCSNMVDAPLTLPAPEIACPECAAGHHVWSPGGPRD